MEIRATLTSRSGTLTVQKIRRTPERRLVIEATWRAPHDLNYADYESRASLVILDPNAIREGR